MGEKSCRGFPKEGALVEVGIVREKEEREKKYREKRMKTCTGEGTR